mgnify:CR=1 FL=1
MCAGVYYAIHGADVRLYFPNPKAQLPVRMRDGAVQLLSERLDRTDDEGARDRIRRVLIDSGLAARVFGLNPRAMTDDEVDDATSAYRLVRLDLMDRCNEDPADLRWVWLPVAAGAAILIGVSAIAYRCRA